MPTLVIDGASLACSFGSAPGVLTVCGDRKSGTEKRATATIADHQPGANLSSFGLCSSLSNPTVAAATSRAKGHLRPQPCVPNTPAPWTPGAASVSIQHQPALTHDSTCACAWGGVIRITSAGQGSGQVGDP